MKNPRLNQPQKDFILLLATVQPHLSYEQMQSIFESKFNSPLSHKQLKDLLKKIRPIIEETQASEELTYELAKKIGLISLTQKVNRLMVLEDLVHKSIEGSPHEVHTAKGTSLIINKKDFAVALNAIKQIRDEVGKDSNQQTSYVIQIGDSSPPDHEDYQELETDEGL
jgi:hypothetical protein